jgi:hypothetical protein
MRLRSKVIKVERKRITRSAHMIDRGLPTERTVVEYDDLGWFVFLEGNVSLHCGAEQPPFSAGDDLIVTLEKSEALEGGFSTADR